MKPGSIRRSAAPRYTAPTSWQQIPSSQVGFSNGTLLKFPVLFMAGDLSLLERPAVAIVGSRKATPEGRKRAAQLARELVKHGVVVMSGLAEGIDEAAHQAAIEYGGKTIAVIGTPLEKAYPVKHAALQERIYKEHLLISQFEQGHRTYPSDFPLRNQVMARLSRATVIVEASETSGSLHQAVECERVGRSLFIAESIFGKFEWPNRFKTAQRLTDPQQVIADICG